MKKFLTILLSSSLLLGMASYFVLANEKNYDMESNNKYETNNDNEEEYVIPDYAITSDDIEFSKRYKQMGVYFEKNDSFESDLKNEDNFGEAQDFIDYYKDETKSMKVEHLLFTSLSDKRLEKRIPAIVITLEGVRLQSQGGNPFNHSNAEEKKDTINETKIVIDEKTKEIISIYSGSHE